MNDDEGSSHPRLLLITGRCWPETSRLALAARDAGFRVDLLAPRASPVAQLEWVQRIGSYSVFWPARSVSRVLNESRFDAIVPADDLAAKAVFDAYLAGRLNERARAAVRRSLGDAETFLMRHARAAVGDVAFSGGVSAPRTWAVTEEEALPGILTRAGFPAVLKSDGSFGGGEVIVVRDIDSARAVYRTLSRPPGLLSSLRLLFGGHDPYHLSRTLLRRKRSVSVQEFVEGTPATLSAVAWGGEVLGSVGFRVLRTRGTHGPASIIEPLSHPDMDRAAKVIARQLGLSGPFGLDFMLSRDGSTASLLELNPRAAPTTHLHLPCLRRPLFHLLADCVGADTPAPRPPLSAEQIALFPQSLADQSEDADPRSASAYLDVPQAQDVVDLCLSTVAVLPARSSRSARRLTALSRHQHASALSRRSPGGQFGRAASPTVLSHPWYRLTADPRNDRGADSGLAREPASRDKLHLPL
jgi:hypothetical protein